MPDNNQAVTVRKRGGQTVYRPEIAQMICDRIASGLSLRAICRADGFPPESTVREWVVDNRDGFAAHYTRARDKGLDSLADQCLDIADCSNPEEVQVARLRVDTRKWYLSKLAPKRYGDRLTVSGDADAPIVAEPDTKDLARRVAFILAMGEDEAESEA